MDTSIRACSSSTTRARYASARDSALSARGRERTTWTRISFSLPDTAGCFPSFQLTSTESRPPSPAHKSRRDSRTGQPRALQRRARTETNRGARALTSRREGPRNFVVLRLSANHMQAHAGANGAVCQLQHQRRRAVPDVLAVDSAHNVVDFERGPVGRAPLVEIAHLHSPHIMHHLRATRCISAVRAPGCTRARAAAAGAPAHAGPHPRPQPRPLAVAGSRIGRAVRELPHQVQRLQVGVVFPPQLQRHQRALLRSCAPAHAARQRALCGAAAHRGAGEGAGGRRARISPGRRRRPQAAARS